MSYEIKYYIRSFKSNAPEQWLTEISAKVTHGDGVLIAKGKFYYADLENAMNEGFSPDYVLDLHAQTYPFLIAFFNSDNFEIKDEVLEKLNYEGWSTNLFIIDRLEVLPEFRRQGLSEVLIEDAIRLFSSNADLIALKSFPLQDEQKSSDEKSLQWNTAMKMDELSTSPGYEAKLSGHYKKLGFIDLGCDSILAKVKSVE